jgi:hypothetical protein
MMWKMWIVGGMLLALTVPAWASAGGQRAGAGAEKSTGVVIRQTDHVWGTSGGPRQGDKPQKSRGVVVAPTVPSGGGGVMGP